MIREAIKKVVGSGDLNRQEMMDCMSEIMSGEATASQIAAFITALRIKGETIEEITGAAMVMREKAENINVEGAEGSMILDTCGTGGSGTGVFNVSTAVSFIASASGLRVAKHGNKGVSSRCGSADVFKALGVNVELSPQKVKKCIEETGIGFLFAPVFHKAMKHAIGPRKEIGIRTVFNVLGPLTNPAGANCQLMGVYKEELTEPIANVLKNLGTKRAYVVHGSDNLDEVSLTSETRISELKDKKIKTFTLKPEDLGFKRVALEDLKGGDPQRNADIIREILDGKEGPKTDIAVLNSSFALTVGEKAGDFKEGVSMAREIIKSGAAKKRLESLVEFTNR